MTTENEPKLSYYERNRANILAKAAVRDSVNPNRKTRKSKFVKVLDKAQNVLDTQKDEPEVFRTDEEIRKMLEQRFDIMNLMTAAACEGTCRALVVSGPAGLGKSYEIEKAVYAYQNATGARVEYIKGMVRATAVYRALWNTRRKGSILMFDDADSIFFDLDSLNLLKGACDTTDTRGVGWGAETKMEDETGELLPRSFEYEGSVIFITNYNFDKAIDKGHRLSEHFQALISRSHYIDLGMGSKRDYLIRIEMVVEKGMLSARGFRDHEAKEIMEYVNNNADRLRELSLRIVVKISDLFRAKPARWQEVAEITLMKGR